MDNFRKLFEADQKKFTNGIKAISKKCKKGVVSLSDEEGILKGFSKDPKEFKSEVATIKKTFDNEFGSYMDKFYFSDKEQKQGYLVIIDEN